MAATHIPYSLESRITSQLLRIILSENGDFVCIKAVNDAAYSLAAQLLAAKLNVAAGAGHSSYIDDIIAEAQELLADAGFNGTGGYWKGGKNAAEERQEALYLAGILDQYNNGMI